MLEEDQRCSVYDGDFRGGGVRFLRVEVASDAEMVCAALNLYDAREKAGGLV